MAYIDTAMPCSFNRTKSIGKWIWEDIPKIVFGFLERERTNERKKNPKSNHFLLNLLWHGIKIKQNKLNKTGHMTKTIAFYNFKNSFKNSLVKNSFFFCKTEEKMKHHWMCNCRFANFGLPPWLLFCLLLNVYNE